MTPVYRDRYKGTIINTPGIGGALVLDGALSGYQRFDATDNGLLFDIVINDIGNAWEIRKECQYTHATSTLSAGTFSDSSSGSAIALTSSAIWAVTLLSERTFPSTITTETNNDILSYNSTTGRWENKNSITMGGASTFNSTLTATSTIALNGATTTATTLGTAASTGTTTIGGTAQTGTITIGRSTATQVLNLGNGATASGSTKSIAIGTAGVAGSTTSITLGSAVSGATNGITINGSTAIVSAASRVGIGIDSGGSISIGRADNTASSPYIDFNSGATSVDYDTRIMATSGNGTVGNGTLGILTGAVGIGTSTPGAKLEVNGTVRFPSVGTSGIIGLGASGALSSVTIGSGLDLTAGVLTSTYSYTLPTASTTVLGGVKIDGTSITIDGSGVITANSATTAINASVLRQYVKNDTGAVITKGQVVYVSGASGTNVLISLAKADSDTTSATTIGFAAQDFTVNGFGYIITEGILTGLDTSAAIVEGDPIWLSPTTAGGVLYGMANKPVAPAHMVYLGVVSRKNAINGEIFIKCQNGYELDELHNVLISAPVDTQVLTYEASSQLWKNKPSYSYSLPTASTTTLGGVKVDGTTITISGGVISSSGGGTPVNVLSPFLLMGA